MERREYCLVLVEALREVCDGRANRGCCGYDGYRGLPGLFTSARVRRYLDGGCGAGEPTLARLGDGILGLLDRGMDTFT